LTAISTAQDAIFGPRTSDKPPNEPAEAPADPRLQQAPKASIEEALRDQHRSAAPKELLAEANVAQREKEKGEEDGVEGGGEEVKAM
jgi:flagellar biosynthesis/type III secretory pathway protein FliH